ncbi:MULTISPECIES: CHAP domain-containing protein [Micromonospora]|uniref:CHAP domain-containing protein n=1 Tax=Micromonospora TaxID=1873 RepID=UPI00131A2E1A|nr:MULTISPECIES: CHAP domain-containing protein [Micromonospora]NES14988.1 CHAP domain-containing protein [Micromonospora sp. PPF5-17B]NES39128.1 CHAP domain-containing protein [Micromonospora solifontis]NES57513.1 CHAP domain-containing protein [Micromonospora sp. PPF5-6]
MRLKRILLSALALALVPIGTTVVLAQPAQADPTFPLYGPYPATTAIDGRGSMNPDDRDAIDLYTTGEQIYLRCQDSGPSVGGSGIWDYTREGHWVPDAYVRTGVSGFVSGVPRCLALGIDGHATTGTIHGPYSAKVDIDGRGSANPDDRVRTDAYLAGSLLYLKCQDYGVAVGGSTLWDYTYDGYWVPDVYVSTGTSGWISGMPSCSSLGISGGVAGNPNGGRQFLARTTLNGYHGKSLGASSVVDRYAEGTFITVMCQAYGEFNYGGSAIWDKTSDGLWVADFYVRTGSTDIVMNRCDNDGPSGGGNRFLVKTTLNGYQSKSLSSTSVVDKYPGGSYVTLVCQAYGEFNYGGSAIWDKTSDGLWVADYYVYTGDDDIVMDRCDSDPKPTGGPGNPSVPGDPTPGSVPDAQIRDRIVNAALSQVGVHEWGDNCNPYGQNGVQCGWAWCSMFASWTWRQAGINVFLPYSGSFYNWGQSRGLLRSKSNIRPGDVVLFGANSGSSDHIGVVASVEPDGRITTIEGNWGNQVKVVGPYDPYSPGPTHENIYGVVAPVNDSSDVWQNGAVTSDATCTAEKSSNGVDYQLCQEVSGTQVRSVVEVWSGKDQVVRASVYLGGAGDWDSAKCESTMLRANTWRKCVTAWKTIKYGGADADATVTAGGSERPELHTGVLKLRGWAQEKGNYCGPGTLQAAAASMGISTVPSQDELASESHTSSTGTLPSDMASTLSGNTPIGMGYDFYGWYSFGDSNLPLEYGIDRVRRGIKQGQPSILLVKPQLLPWGTSGGSGLVRHYVMIYGYGSVDSSAGETGQYTSTFKVWDPWDATTHDMTLDELITAANAAEVPGDITTISPKI